jgi:hypothetical protein
MPQQFVTQPAPPSASDNMEALFLNLVENVAYRRAKQNMKVAQKQDLEAKMAAGLLPKTEITVTDEGFQFAGEDSPMDQSAAREAFYRAVGGLDPRDDKSRGGFTQVREEMVPGQAEQFAAQVAQAQGAAAEAMPEDMDALQRGNFAVASALAGNIGAKAATPRTMPQPQLPSQKYGDGAVLNPNGNALEQRAAQRLLPFPAGQGVATRTLPMPTIDPNAPTPMVLHSSNASGTGAASIGSKASELPPTPTSLGAMLANKIRSAKPVATPTKIETPAPAPDTKISMTEGAGQKWKGAGKIDVEMERGGFETQMPTVSEKTTMVQSAQYDEIKRSIPKLAGLAALENYGNQIMMTRGYNTGAPMQETFSGLLTQRVADLKRWEEAATKSGVATTLEKQSDRRTKVEGSKNKLGVMQSEEMKTDIRVGGATLNAPSPSPASIIQANLPSTEAGATTQISYDERGVKLTGPVSNLAFRSTGDLRFTEGNGLVNVLKLKADQASKLGRGNYNVKILQQSGGQPQMVQVQTPTGAITLTYQAGLEKSVIKDDKGNVIQTHGWKVEAPTGMELAELQRFTGHNITGGNK